MGYVLMFLVLVVLLLVLPRWPHSRTWGWIPALTVALIFILLIALWLSGRLG